MAPPSCDTVPDSCTRRGQKNKILQVYTVPQQILINGTSMDTCTCMYPCWRTSVRTQWVMTSYWGGGGGGYFVSNAVMGARWSRRGVGVPQECGTVPVAKVFG